MSLREVLSRAAALILLALACTVSGDENANAQLHWPGSSHKEHFRIRVIGRVMALPRTSFFTNHEIFLVEKALNREEGTLMKLVYEFLPYQPSLADVGMQYATIYDIHATRDPQCDESLFQLLSAHDPQHDPDPKEGFEYASDAPELNMNHQRRKSLPCYQTSAEDFGRSERVPLQKEQPEARPVLK